MADSISPVAKKRIRIVFYLLLPALFVQFFFAKYVEEPYPGFLFPLFGGVNGKDGIYPTPAEEVYIYAGSDTIPSSKQELFRMANESYRYYLMRDFLGPETPDSVKMDPGFQTWMASNLQSLTGREDVHGLQVIWKMKYYNSLTDPVEITEEVNGTYSLSLLSDLTPASN